MPPELWAHAVALPAVVPPSRVAKPLRWRLADLNKPMGTRQASLPPGAPLSMGVVAVPPVPARPQAPATIQCELSRADGSRLCRHGAESTWPLETWVRAFLAVRACANSPPKVVGVWRRTPSIAGQASRGSVPCGGRSSASLP